jgi:hypothetical protein
MVWSAAPCLIIWSVVVVTGAAGWPAPLDGADVAPRRKTGRDTDADRRDRGE